MIKTELSELSDFSSKRLAIMAEVSSEEKARDMDERDYDGKIMAQERLLEKEVQESAPLVGARSQINSLGQEYACDPVYLQKIAVREGITFSCFRYSSYSSSSSPSSSSPQSFSFIRNNTFFDIFSKFFTTPHSLLTLNVSNSPLG